MNALHDRILMSSNHVTPVIKDVDVAHDAIECVQSVRHLLREF